MAAVLVVEPDEKWKGIIIRALSRAHQVTFCHRIQEALAKLHTTSFDAIVLEGKTLQPDENVSLSAIKESAPYSPIIITGQDDKAEFIVKVVKAGAADYVPKPYSENNLLIALEQVLETRSLKNEIMYLRRQQDIIYDFDRIIAVSPNMQKVMTTVKKYAQTDSTVLMTGETGTGKSVLSGAIHFNSSRRNKPFIQINCANIPENLLESELFGHEKGAFTGANKTRAGRLEQANGGTVFLDEIGELSQPLQAKLLRVLEEKSFERLGGNRTIRTDIRIISATNRNLEEQVASGNFREDLYYRINVLRVHLPPLRERIECIEPLAYHLLDKLRRSVKKQILGFTPEVIEMFKRYPWPGNIRELSNVIERALLIEEDKWIHPASVSLPELSRTPHHSVPNEFPRDLKELNEHEKKMVLEALEKSLWVQKDAAAMLGISPRALNYKIQKYGLKHSRWRKNR